MCGDHLQMFWIQLFMMGQIYQNGVHNHNDDNTWDRVPCMQALWAHPQPTNWKHVAIIPCGAWQLLETSYADGEEPPGEWAELVTLKSSNFALDEEADYIPQLQDEWLTLEEWQSPKQEQLWQQQNQPPEQRGQLTWQEPEPTQVEGPSPTVTPPNKTTMKPTSSHKWKAKDNKAWSSHKHAILLYQNCSLLLLNNDWWVRLWQDFLQATVPSYNYTTYISGARSSWGVTTYDWKCIHALKAKKYNKDNPHFHQAMNDGQYATEYKEAMNLEVNALERVKTWSEKWSTATFQRAARCCHLCGCLSWNDIPMDPPTSSKQDYAWEATCKQREGFLWQVCTCGFMV